ncbi:hypothetical protein PF010_g31560 [Phytophthora fragariae]|uniref:Uncharacterized protein n=1 Tax=Phytophthora fragariae TaxID=53985 RepID=A0A6G0JH19_9STRA|nr:hypothetical protein PF010_g31560 [Phytophthora fragariae]KAE9153839.1 hypothetical protein PF004_g32795 [Phytophthora fragariae]
MRFTITCWLPICDACSLGSPVDSVQEHSGSLGFSDLTVIVTLGSGAHGSAPLLLEDM